MKKYIVKKEYAGIKPGTEVNVSPIRERYMLDMGYIEPLKQKPKRAPKNKAIEDAIENK